MENNGLLEMYSNECRQLLQSLEAELYLAENTGSFAKSVMEVFRIVHTLKGGASMMFFDELANTAHKLENILAIVRDDSHKVQSFDKLIIDLCYKLMEYYSAELELVCDGYVCLKNDQLNLALDSAQSAMQQNEQNEQDVQEKSKVELIDPKSAEYTGYNCIKVHLKPCKLVNVRAMVYVKTMLGMCKSLLTSPVDIKEKDSAKYIEENGLTLLFIPLDDVEIKEIYSKIEKQAYFASYDIISIPEKVSINGQVVKNNVLRKTSGATGTIAVNQSKVNDVLRHIGVLATMQTALEVYLTENKIINDDILTIIEQIKRHTALLQDSATQMGMVKMEAVFFQMRRLIRAMQADTGKKITLSFTGEDILVDKSVIDVITESLLHIARNAMDHGIEPAEQRKLASKREIGHVAFDAKRTSSMIFITVTDDGKGIDKDSVLDAAEKMNLLCKDRDLYTENEIFSLLSIHGVTTRSSVSKYSGRGVGLDVAVGDLRKIGGNITISSKANQGTSVCLAIPVTLAVIDGAEVQKDGKTIIFSTKSICRITYDMETVVLTDSLGVSYIDGEEYKQLVFANQSFQNPHTQGALLLVKRSVGNYFICVDKIVNVKSMFLKPIPRVLSNALGSENVFSGCVIDGTGAVRCVVDVNKLVVANESYAHRRLR